MELSKKKCEIGDVKQNCEEASKSAETAEYELKKAKQQFDEEFLTLKREHENKVQIKI